MRIAIGLCSLKCRAHEIEWRLARRIMISFWLYSHSPVAQSTNIMPLFVGSFFFVFCSYSSALANTEFNLNKSQQERKMEWRKEIIIIESLFYDPINLNTRMKIALTRAHSRSASQKLKKTYRQRRIWFWMSSIEFVLLNSCPFPFFPFGFSSFRWWTANSTKSAKIYRWFGVSVDNATCTKYLSHSVHPPIQMPANWLMVL